MPKPLVFLAQSDTTAGLLSEDFTHLNQIKARKSYQEILKTLASFKVLKQYVRVPQKHKNYIRRASKSTFIYPKRASLQSPLALRFVKDFWHQEFLKLMPPLYSTSANPHKQSFSLDFALQKADIVVLDKRGIFANKPSKIFKISNHKMRRVR